MAFEVITAPGDDKTLAAAAREVLEAAVKIGNSPMDIEGFLYSWISGTRVVIERDDTTREIVSLGIFTAGEQWPHVRTVAHILRIDGNEQATFDFIKTLCKAIGVRAIYHETGEQANEDGTITHFVTEFPM